MNVLMAPATVVISDKAGSVPGIGYNIIKRLCDDGVKIYAITKKVLVNKPIPNLYAIETNNLNPNTIYKITKFILKKKNIDIIHHLCYHRRTPNLYVFDKSVREKYPIIIGPTEGGHKLFDDEYPFYKRNFLKYIAIRGISKSTLKIRDLLTAIIFRKADIIIAASKESKQILSKLTDRRKIKIVYHGVDLNKFKYFTPPENYNILTVGNHIRRKGFEYLIFAMKLVTKEFPEAKLYITSDGPRRSYLENLVRKLKLAKNVIFTGRIPEEQLLNLYKNCRLFVHPSLSESFSPVRLEAMAVGRPIVATEVTGSKEMITHGKEGFLVKPKDYKSLAGYIIQLLGDYELCIKMGKNARRKVEEKFDWDKNVKHYHKIYNKLL